ncbi:hypothetical protein FXO38_22432, partial [Capsicum annuum]
MQSKAHWELNLLRKNTSNNLRREDGILSKALKNRAEMERGSKIFLFLYRIEELNVLVDAVEGKLSAIYRWARQDLGLALSSYVNKERQLAGKLSCKPEESVVKETSSGLPIASVKKEKNDGNAALLTKASSSAFPLPKDKQSREPLASFMPDNTSHGIEGTKNGFQSKCDESIKSVPAYTAQVTQLSVDGGSCLGDGDVILLSDDEGEEENNSIPSRDTVGKQTVNWGNSDKPVATASIDGARVTEDGVNGSLGSDSVKVFKDNANVEIHRRPNQETHSF